MAEPANLPDVPAGKTEAVRTGPSAWTAPHDVYTGGTFYPAGEPFITEAPRGRAWRPASPAERGAAEAKVAAAEAGRRKVDPARTPPGA